MAKYDFEEFQQLVEQFQQEMSLKQMCEQEGVDYRHYISWRKKKGLSRTRRSSEAVAGEIVEVDVSGLKESCQAKTAKVGIVFENGLRFERDVMMVDTLIEFLTKIKPVLCLS